MPLPARNFCSKIGRRIFFLFVICALLPISVLGLVCYWQVSDQLRESSRRELQYAAKSYGMGLLYRLQLLNSALQNDSQQVLATNQVGRAIQGAWLGQSLFVDGTRQKTWGSAPTLPTLSPDEQQRLISGSSILLVSTHIEFYRYLDPQKPERGLIGGTVNPSFLFSSDALPANAQISIRDASNRLLYCSQDAADCDPSFLNRRWVFGRFPSQHNRRQIENGSWRLFLRPEFQQESWTIVASENADQVLAPMHMFHRTFPYVLLLALWIVALLSAIQIRRTLVPLEHLRLGTKRLAEKQFDSPVTVQSGDEFEELAHNFNAMAASLRDQFAALHRMHWGALKALARAIDAKSTWTAGHSERVTQLALKLAGEMSLTPAQCEILKRGALLHDIGKIGTPPEILDKRGRLTAEELQIMRDHVLTGVRILEPLPDFEPCLSVVAQHHEWFNGSGYPCGLVGADITLIARIVAVADCFDALISDRPYRAGKKIEEVVEFISQGSGKQFDPKVVEAFSRVMANHHLANVTVTDLSTEVPHETTI